MIHFQRLRQTGALVLASAFIMANSFAADAPLKEIKLDYAYYSPPSLVVKQMGWLEEAFKNQGTEVKWVFSRGSNNSLEFLNSGASNFALTSSVSSFVARANGQPVKIIFNYSWAEPSTVEVLANSPIKSIQGLKGKKIAVTKGTDPYFYLLRALGENGLTLKDVEIVHLQHPEGKVALEQGRVDAWVGIDPHLAAAKISGTRTIYSNPNFALGAVLNSNEAFLQNNPEAVKTVIQAYERARQWIIEHPKEVVDLVSAQTELSKEVTEKQIGRIDFTRWVPGDYTIEAIRPVVPLLEEAGILRKNAKPQEALQTLIDAAPATAVAHEQ